MNSSEERTATFTPHAALLTGGFDRPYVLGLSMALVSQGVTLDIIGSDELDSPEMQHTPGVRFLNLLSGPRVNISRSARLWRIARFYLRLFRYLSVSKARVFHILWNNKLHLFDRTLLMLLYKMLGKRVVFTAHNVNAGKRDGNDSLLNRWTLLAQYRIADHILVHTEAMKTELCEDFGIGKSAVTVVPFGIDTTVPHTSLTNKDAKQRLGLLECDKAILFFGAIRPYKGLEYLLSAFQFLAGTGRDYRLIIAGEPKKGDEVYMDAVRRQIESHESRGRIVLNPRFIREDEAETYIKAADVLVLPYTMIFQSGVLFLAYSFGLPVVATRVGAFEDDVLEGRTGFLCAPCDAGALALTVERYFNSELFRGQETARNDIREYFHERNSWQMNARLTAQVYTALTGDRNLAAPRLDTDSGSQRAEMDSRNTPIRNRPDLGAEGNYRRG